ncbi:hypothetical protein E2C01_083026 [Portunus trituberculatus]|uniref:Uncharacterized protein n=1 Tax=Portunus trituberculatus TaxID=210409 RepID=A0A5B7J0U4_PORTR|nr:hypothetical protein [Portunus trituberculatus]
MGQKGLKSASGGGGEACPATRLAPQRARPGPAGEMAVLGPVVGLDRAEN